ncbi:MAG: substrate-binding domain-containing protein [Oscillospiraceae bacterium]|nr:substrate-binding domain-containing protein [Oscillospiraceae bacterium]
MKKIISLLLVVLMAAGLLACGGGGQNGNIETSGTETQTPDASASETAAAPPDGGADTPAVSADAPQNVGYIDDPVDHFARDTYQIAYLSPAFMFLQQSWFAAMQAFEERLNFKVTSFTGENNSDTYLTNIELIASQGYDGIIMDCEQPVAVRAYEIIEETGVPYIAFVQSLLDENGKTVCPQVVLDQYDTGKKTIDWLIANYKSYWGEIDASTLGLIDCTVTTSPDLALRAVAPEEIFKATFPEGHYFMADMAAAGGVTADAAYTQVMATVSAHPEIEHWWVTGSTEFFGSGSARVFDDLGKVDDALVCVVGAGANIVDWDSMTPDTKSSLVACLAISDLLYAAPAVSGVIALIDGRATKETLWRDKTPADWQFGTDYGVWLVENDIITRDTYKTYFEEINAKYLLSGGHTD